MKGTPSSISAETRYRVGAVSRAVSVVGICARFHVETRDANAVLQAFDCLESIDTAPSRELFIFAAAVIKRHRENQVRWTVALRRAS